MTSPGAEIPSHRACAHCRSQKVRCIASDHDPDVCQRCARSGRACVFTPLQKRKQRKRTDTRVAELEREMRSMRAALNQKNESSTSPESQRQEPQREEGLSLWYQTRRLDAPRIEHPARWEQGEAGTAAADRGHSTDEAERRLSSVSTRPSVTQPQILSPQHVVLHSDDVIDRGILSLSLARELFETYRTDLLPHYPMVVIPPSVTADEMRYSRPTLFLAILAAASGKENSDLSTQLDAEVLQVYAARVLVKSQKSLELVQALLVNATWYHPPSRFGELKYYEYILMAITMAMDIGVASRPTTHRARITSNGPANAKPPTHPAEDAHNADSSAAPRNGEPRPETTSINSRRTWLACYVLCSCVSLSIRRPNMLHTNSYIRDCVDCLERSPEALPTDRTVIAWAKLVMIADEISASFCLDDPGGIAIITELRTQLMLRDFSQRLNAWYSNLSEADAGPGSLLIMYYNVRLYLREIALHVDHSPEDFRAPYQMGDIQQIPHADQIPTQILAESVSDCIQSAHSLMSTFTSMSADGLRAVPVFTFVRVSFAAFVLAKLCLSAARPTSRIASVLDRTSIKAEAYLDRTILHVRKIVGTHRCRVPAIFLALLFKLRQWCLNPDMINRPDQEPRPAAEQRMHKGRSADLQSRGLGKDAAAAGSEVAESLPSGGLFADALNDDSRPAGEDSRPTGVVQFVDGPSVNGSTAATAPVPAEGAEYPEASAQIGIQHADGVTVPNNNNSTAHNHLPSTEQMDVDGNLFDLLGDMNAFSAGGLTGLDDWGMVPLDAYEMDNMYYQMPAPGYGHHSGG